MREDYQEALDKMFPDGWGIAYSCPDKQIRWAHFDPHQTYVIGRLWELAKELNMESEKD